MSVAGRRSGRRPPIHARSARVSTDRQDSVTDLSDLSPIDENFAGGPGRPPARPAPNLRQTDRQNLKNNVGETDERSVETAARFEGPSPILSLSPTSVSEIASHRFPPPALTDALFSHRSKCPQPIETRVPSPGTVSTGLPGEEPSGQTHPFSGRPFDNLS